MTSIDTRIAAPDVAEDIAVLDRDGIVGRKAVFERAWVERMRTDVMAAFEDARGRERGAVSRGPQRWYVEVHPEQISGFVDLVSNRWIRQMCESVLGPGYRFVEIGFDVPFQGAKNQPWHRDFRSPPETYRDRRLSSLAFNLTGVDVTPDMGPFEIAPGTQWEPGQEWKHGMFPPREEWHRFETVAVRKFPEMGDVSCRTGLTIHRGTEHASPTPRPVLILGVVAGEKVDGTWEWTEEHDLSVTRPFYEALPQEVRDHLLCRVVDELIPLTQRHDIEGLVMGVEE